MAVSNFSGFFFLGSFPGRGLHFSRGSCFWGFPLGVSVLMGGVKKSQDAPLPLVYYGKPRAQNYYKKRHQKSHQCIVAKVQVVGALRNTRINWIFQQSLLIQNHLRLSITQKRRNNSKYVTQNSIRLCEEYQHAKPFRKDWVYQVLQFEMLQTY